MTRAVTGFLHMLALCGAFGAGRLAALGFTGDAWTFIIAAAVLVVAAIVLREWSL